MDENPERALTHPTTDRDRAALVCLLRLHGQGLPPAEIASSLRAETGIDLAPAALDRVLREIAGPVPRAEGGDPDYFSGYLGGG